MAEEETIRQGRLWDKIAAWVFVWAGPILFCLAVAAVLSAIYEPTQFIWLDAAALDASGNKKWSGEATRSLSLVLGGLGALYGLILAAPRQITFSKQVEQGQKQAETAEKNLFNDRLGRGVELLSDAKMTMRSAGVRVLENLAESIDADSEEHRLVFNILLDFVRDKAKPLLKPTGDALSLSDKSWPPTEPRIDRLDIELAILAIGKITPASMRMQINLAGLDLRELNLTNADLHGADFRWANLENAILTEGNFQNTNFMQTRLRGSIIAEGNFRGAHMFAATFEGVVLREINFQDADLSSASFEDAKVGKSDFRRANLKNIKFRNTYLSDCKFRGADISKGRGNGWKKEILNDAVYDRDNLPQDYVDGSITRLRTSHRAYEWRDGKRVFVQSDMPESGQDVDEWIANEIGNAGYNEDDDS
jgi:uncharacterized protein YjbI with pentapeptide repeats